MNKYFQDELEKYKDLIEVKEGESMEEAFFNLEKTKRDEIMKKMESSRKFETPMTNLVSEVKKNIETMVVSQKTNDKLSIKEEEEYKNGVMVKKGRKQLKIRGALHQDTYYGKTNNPYRIRNSRRRDKIRSATSVGHKIWRAERRNKVT